MKNKLQAAALLILTALVVMAAARVHDRVKQNCEREERVVVPCAPQVK